ncbi:hypothetical protein EYF80_031642 [Liparis tanakae]|uniref:Uncharacterized protein n=1 Tax=Liparis tanakae TaxID=230148 RepID=A0A4Z2GXD4_9TELE|nr:hypothetical protein EYF80_031642 [Liparis tanakae]
MSANTDHRVQRRVRASGNPEEIAQVVVDAGGAALLGQPGRLLHAVLVDVPQHQHGAEGRELLGHEAADPAAGARDQHHLPGYALLPSGHEEVDERLHIVPDGEEEDLEGLQQEIHDGSGMDRRVTLPL